MKKVKLGEGTIRYHINYLKKTSLICEKDERGYTRYYVGDNIGCLEKEMLCILQQDLPRKIILFTLFNFGISQTELSKELEKSPKTIQYHLNKLKEKKIIERATFDNGMMLTNRNNRYFRRLPAGKEIIYRLKNPYLMYDLFLKYKDTFSDDQITSSLIKYLEYISRECQPRPKISDNKSFDRAIGLINKIFPSPWGPL
jgi:DNA-binding transcriptional ArsR family regulator